MRDLLTRDPERALPLVLAHYLPRGASGLAIAALLSGFLATFSSNVNAGASYLVKDVYKRYLNPGADDRKLVRASYVASTLLVAAGLAISFFAQSINLMFLWIMGTLGAGVLAPNVLRWYWWRINGWGYAWGAFAGMALSLMQVIVEVFWSGALPLYVSFPAIVSLTCAVTITASLATQADSMPQLASFLQQTGVWGSWGAVGRVAPPWRDLGNVCLGLPFLIALYLGPVFLILHAWRSVVWCAGIAGVFAALLYVSWYRRGLAEAGKS